MAGNVWEWTDDWWTEPPPRRRRQAVLRARRNPRGGDLEASYDPAQPQFRIPRKVIKGGSHLCADTYCLRYRPAARRPQMIDTGIEPHRLPVRRDDTSRTRPPRRPTDDRRLLPSWRPGPTRDALVAFLDAVPSTCPSSERVACFDNDGTLWCERPNYVQLDFFVDALKSRGRRRPGVAERPEFARAARRRPAAIGPSSAWNGSPWRWPGCSRDLDPRSSTAAVREFMAGAAHPTLGRPLRSCGLPADAGADRRAPATSTSRSAIVTGGGTEFVRAISEDLYGVPPEPSSARSIELRVRRDDGEAPGARSDRPSWSAAANEGAAKVSNIQTQLGRRPILAAGNSGGDREMLEWAAAGDGPTLALLVDHDDAEREFGYEAGGGDRRLRRPITAFGHDSGWTVASMRDDWEQIFASVRDESCELRRDRECTRVREPSDECRGWNCDSARMLVGLVDREQAEESVGAAIRDAVAGLPGAIGSVPDGMAAGVLAGVNPVYGLYAQLRRADRRRASTPARS